MFPYTINLFKEKRREMGGAKWQSANQKTQQMNRQNLPCRLAVVAAFSLIFNQLTALPIAIGTPADTLPARSPVAIELTHHFASLVRHTPKLTIRTGQATPGWEIGLRFPTFGRRDWQVLQHFPTLGLALCRFELGDSAHGAAWGLVPNLTVPIFWGKNWAATFRFGTGLAYVTRPYDYFSNPRQNALGSHWNNVTQFRVGAEARLSGHLRVLAGGSFTHFSNGGTELPNYGVNLPGGYLGIAYSPENEPLVRKRTVNRTPEKRFGALAHVGLAYVEYSVLDGPRYPIWSASLAGTWQMNRVNRWLLGLDWEFNGAIAAWFYQTSAFLTEEQSNQFATRFAVKVADEFLFGDLGVELQVGIYTGEGRFNRALLSPFFTKLGIRYYLPRLPGLPLRPHVGIYLKAHKAIAEYISVNVGFQL